MAGIKKARRRLRYQLYLDENELASTWHDDDTRALARSYFKTMIAAVENLARRMKIPKLPYEFHANATTRHQRGDVKFPRWVELGKQAGVLEPWEEPLLRVFKRSHRLWCKRHEVTGERYTFNILTYDPQWLAQLIRVRMVHSKEDPQ